MEKNESGLQPITDKGWLSGFGNLFMNESGKWWSTSRWWVQSLIWLAIVNGVVVLNIMGLGRGQHTANEGVEFLFIFQTFFVMIGVIIIMQNILVGEKLEGTAALVLSKPVSRTAFVLAMTIATIFPTVLIMIVLQSAVGYALISAFSGVHIEISSFLTVVGYAILHLIFYLTMSLLVGTLFNKRGPVIGIPIVVLFLQMIIDEFTPQAGSVYMPSMIIKTIGKFGMGTMQVPIQPVIVMVVCSLLFVVLAVFRFKREEF